MATAKLPLNLQLPQDLYDKLDAAAQARGLPRATYVRELLMKELKYEKNSERAKRRQHEPWRNFDPVTHEEYASTAPDSGTLDLPETSDAG